MSSLPGGTVTFLFSDIEGSTRLVQEAGREYPALLARHQQLIGAAVGEHAGRLFGSEGDALFAVFESAPAALRAAAAAQRALAAEPWPDGLAVRVRMGIHTGEATVVGDNYVGLTLHQVARVTAAGHGGQVLVSETTARLRGAEVEDGLRLRDEGEHRLRDLPEPVRIFVLAGEGLADDFPPLRTLSARPNNLPVQLTSFVGRDELAAAIAALSATRLLTLSGPGGTGKTRLALQLAVETLDQFPDGVWFIALEAIHDLELVPSAIASALGLGDKADTTPLEVITGHLRERRALLVLDNFEQVVGAGPMVGQLLRDAPQLKVIVTSRIVLRVHGEHELAVPPLALPSTSGAGARLTAEHVGEAAAVRLFVDRARAVQPSFELDDSNAPAVADIVARLDGLPLAIELAAARLRILSVEAIRARLDQRLALLTGGARDLPARQQTLRGAIDWSYQMLEPPERALFERFSVFAGGAYLAEAEAVCGPASELGIDTLDGLAALSDKSLLRALVGGAAEPRFAMLANLREYAAERLADAGTVDQVRERHARAYASLVERCAPLLTQVEGADWQVRLENDHDNLRAAFDWALEGGHADLALGLLAGLWRFWQARGHLHEARQRAERALGMANIEQQPPDLLARAYAAGGGIAYWQGDFVAAHRWYAQALTAAEASGDRAAIALAHYNQGFAALDHDALQDVRYRAGRPWFEKALALYTELGHEQGIADAAWGLSLSAAAFRDVEEASQHARRAFDAYRSLGNAFGAGWAAHMLVLYKMVSGRHEQALDYASQALATFERSQDVSGMVLVAYDVALVLFRQERRAEGLRIAGAVDRLAREAGVGVLGDGFDFLDWRHPEPPADEAGLACWNEGAGWTVEQVVEYARRHLPGHASQPPPG